LFTVVISPGISYLLIDLKAIFTINPSKRAFKIPPCQL